MKGHPYTHATHKHGQERGYAQSCTSYAYPRMGGKSHLSHTHTKKEEDRGDNYGVCIQRLRRGALCGDTARVGTLPKSHGCGDVYLASSLIHYPKSGCKDRETAHAVSYINSMYPDWDRWRGDVKLYFTYTQPNTEGRGCVVCAHGQGM